MRVSIHTKYRHLVIATGRDATVIDGVDQEEPSTYVPMGGGDFTPAPEEEVTFYEDGAAEPDTLFGFAKVKPNGGRVESV